jgi:uncharacterized protein YraI
MEIRMRRTGLKLAAAVAGLLAGSAAASALTAVTTEPLPLRAGPAGDFPVVDQVPADARVIVHGCVQAYRWCDISWRDAHGWARGDELAYLEGSRRVSIIEYGPRARLPIVAFSVDRYWDRYYRSRPFYSERARWRTVWRENDRAEGLSRRGEREERLKDTRSYRNMDRENDKRTDRRTEGNDRRTDRRTEGTDRPTEGKERLKDTRSYRSMDREDNRPNTSRGMRDRSSQNNTTGGERGRPETNAQERSSGSPSGSGNRGRDKAPGGPGGGEKAPSGAGDGMKGR